YPEAPASMASRTVASMQWTDTTRTRVVECSRRIARVASIPFSSGIGPLRHQRWSLLVLTRLSCRESTAVAPTLVLRTSPESSQGGGGNRRKSHCAGRRDALHSTQLKGRKAMAVPPPPSPLGRACPGRRPRAEQERGGPGRPPPDGRAPTSDSSTAIRHARRAPYARGASGAWCGPVRGRGGAARGRARLGDGAVHVEVPGAELVGCTPDVHRGA